MGASFAERAVRSSGAGGSERSQASRLLKASSFAVAGGLLCTICDHLHATHGVLFYRQPSFWSQAWWVPLLFTGATLAVLFGAGIARRLFNGEKVAGSGSGLVADLIAFLAAYMYTSFGRDQPDVVVAVLVAFWLSRVLLAPRWVIAFSLLTAVGGCAFEATLSSTGAFTYHHPDFIGVPRWLAGIYLHVGILGARLDAM